MKPITRCVAFLVCELLLGITCPFPTVAQSSADTASIYWTPQWSIAIDDYGHSDYLLYLSTPFPNAYSHDLLGEWASAVGYVGINEHLPPGQLSMWLNPNFRSPTWVSNSTFHVVSSQQLSDIDGDGLMEGTSIISNDQLEITIDNNPEPIQGGTQLGLQDGHAVESANYVLRQTYTLRNLTSESLSGVRFYQFLHAHPANSHIAASVGLYDPTMYPGGLPEYRYDLTQYGESSGAPDDSKTCFVFQDFVGFSSIIQPTSWGVGGYSGHVSRRPVGVHVDIETDSLENQTITALDEAATAAKYVVPDLGATNTASLQFVLAVNSLVKSDDVHAVDVCVSIDDSGMTPMMTVSHGGCAVSGNGGPYDVAVSPIGLVYGTLSPAEVRYVNGKCMGSGVESNSITLNLVTCESQFIHVRHSGTLDYGTDSSGRSRLVVPDAFDCP